MLLNKTDLVDEATLAEVERRILELNKTVPIVRCQNADVPVESVIGIGAFSLEEVRQSCRCTSGGPSGRAGRLVP